MSDFYATEKIIGGAVLVGLGSLLMWSVSQTGDGGIPAILFGGVAIFGAVWVTVGLFELVVGRPWHRQAEEMSFAEPERTKGSASLD